MFAEQPARPGGRISYEAEAVVARSRIVCLGIPAQIVEQLDPEAGIAKAEISGVRRNVSIALCPEAEVGDWVLVHVGFALSKIDEEEAGRTLALLEQMGEAYDQELRELRESASG
jgi:hydrogenase expression/formation protein HypC